MSDEMTPEERAITTGIPMDKPPCRLCYDEPIKGLVTANSIIIFDDEFNYCPLCGRKRSAYEP